MDRMTYQEVCKRESAALKEINDLFATTTLTQEFRDERDAIYARHLEGTDWTKETLQAEVRRRCAKAYAEMKATGTFSVTL